MRRRPALVLLLAILAGCSGGGSSPVPAATTAQGPSASTGPASASPTASPAAVSDAVPSRVVIAELEIDLPVVSGALALEGNPPDYPLCDVAQYLTTYRYPGRPGTTTWIYAHAREGMFLPLLEASMEDDGAALVGVEVDVYATDATRYTYRITEVLRHATDRSAAAGVPATEGRLILQTSEGPRGTVPKLQVVAVQVDIATASEPEAMPTPSPRVCA